MGFKRQFNGSMIFNYLNLNNISTNRRWKSFQYCILPKNYISVYCQFEIFKFTGEYFTEIRLWLLLDMLFFTKRQRRQYV